MNGNDDFDGPQQGTAQAAPPHADLGSVDDAMTSGAPAAQFKAVGAVVRGTILSAQMAQQRDMQSGKLAFWDDGNPKTQILIVLQTTERSDEIEDDTGQRMLYVKKPSNMLAAIAKALGPVKLSQAIGGELAIKYIGDGEPTKRGYNPPKKFAARFTPTTGTTQGQSQPPPAQPRQQQAAPPQQPHRHTPGPIRGIATQVLPEQNTAIEEDDIPFRTDAHRVRSRIDRWFR